MIYVVVGIAVCAAICAVLLRGAGQNPWGGVLLGLLLGPLGVALAVWIALAHKPTTSP